MDLSSMTLKEFIEFSDIYEYSQDYYDITKAFMELSLMQLHLESYQYLLETKNITLDQLDIMMIESGINDKSIYTEDLYFEKVNGVFGGIKQFFIMTGNAIASGIRKVSSIFIAKNKEADEIVQHTKMINKKMEDLELVNAVVNTGDNIRSKVKIAQEVSDQIDQSLNGMIERVNRTLGGGGAKFIPIISDSVDNPIKVINNTAKNIVGNEISEEALNLQAILLQNEYEIEGLALIDELESIPEMISDVMIFKDGDLASDVAYNSLKKILKSGFNGYFERIRNVRDTIETKYRQNKRFTLSVSTLKSKIEAADKLRKLFTELANISDIGPENNSNMIAQIFANNVEKSDNQKLNKEAIMNDVTRRVKTDKEIGYSGINPFRKMTIGQAEKNKFIAEYPNYLRRMHELARTLQIATAEVFKVLNEHMKVREEAIAGQAALTKAMESINSSETQN